MKLLTICSVLLMLSCTPSSVKKIDFQGHRGARGLMPENTIPGFLHALDLGVNTLEMDVVVTGDGRLLVSHEPIISAEICLDSIGNELSDSGGLKLNIYRMTYEEIEQYDCGTKAHPRFPEQMKTQVTKPLFNEVVEVVELYVNEKNLPKPNYNIEIKSSQSTDCKYHPLPADFSEITYSKVNELLPWERVTIQSFDFRILQYFHSQYPEVRLVQLVENELPFDKNLDSLGFTPDVYGCYFPLLSRDIIRQLHDRGIKVIPWTVNEVEDMNRLIAWEVDGIITDYPNRISR